MRLIDNEDTVTIDESSAKCRSVKGEPVLIYRTTTYEDGVFVKTNMVIQKVEAFKGKIVTDGGTEYNFANLSISEKCALLVKLLGQDFTPGAIDEMTLGASNSEEASKKHYEELDKNGKTTIDVTIWNNAPEGVTGFDESLELQFAREGDAITVKDVINNADPDLVAAAAGTGYVIVGVAEGKNLEATVDNILSEDDKLLEDQEVTLVWAKAVTINVKRNLVENDDATVDVTVPFNATVNDLIEAINANETVLGWVSEAEGTHVLAGVVKANGSEFTENQLKKAASNFAEAGVALSWSEVPPAVEDPQPEQP